MIDCVDDRDGNDCMPLQYWNIYVESSMILMMLIELKDGWTKSECGTQCRKNNVEWLMISMMISMLMFELKDGWTKAECLLQWLLCGGMIICYSMISVVVDYN